MRRILLLACFAVLAFAAFAADTNPQQMTGPAEINGVTPTATQPPPTETPPTPTQPTPTQPPGPTPTVPPS